MIAPILPVVSNVSERSKAIRAIAVDKGISKQTIRYYLCLFLVYQNKNVLAPKRIIKEIELTQDQKNMRWALNKYFYTEHKNSLRTAYTYLLKEKYCDDNFMCRNFTAYPKASGSLRKTDTIFPVKAKRIIREITDLCLVMVFSSMLSQSVWECSIVQFVIYTL